MRSFHSSITSRAPELLRSFATGQDADQREWTARADAAQVRAAEALERLVTLAEQSDTGQASRAAGFVAAVVGRNQFDMYSLRSLDVDLSDAVLACLDAVRWARCPLQDLLPQGLVRIEAVCVEWGFKTTITGN